MEVAQFLLSPVFTFYLSLLRNHVLTVHNLKAASPQRIVILRALQLGDLLCAVPALRALRAAFPQADITLVGLPWAQEFVDRFAQYLTGFIEFPGYPGLPERTQQLAQIPEFLSSLQRANFDVAIQLHGSGALTNPIISLFGARLTTGFYRPGEYCPDEQYFLPYPDSEPEVRRLLHLITFLGIPEQGEELEFPLMLADHQAFILLADTYKLQPGTYVCIHPGARLLSRRWEPKRFAAVADGLAAQGVQVVLTGAADEWELCHHVVQSMRAPAINLAGKTSLGMLGVLLTGACLLICNDTGISHVAAALLTPSIVVVCGSDPQRWAPLDQERHRVIYSPITCRPCFYFTCPIDHPCATNVSSETVLTQAVELLSRYNERVGREITLCRTARELSSQVVERGGI
jgi:ADP-heptose:LPS heptosyltransferase